MNLASVWRRLKEEPEWTILGLLTLLLVVGGSVLYYNRTLQAEQRAKEQFNRATSVYTQAQRRGNFEQAIPVLERFVRNYPSSNTADKALFFLGKSYFQQEQYVQAQKQFFRLVENYPKSSFFSSARMYIALCYQKREQYDQAKELLEKLSQIDTREPLWPEVMWRLALVYRETGEDEKARRILNRLVENAPEHADYWQSLAENVLNTSSG